MRYYIVLIFIGLLNINLFSAGMTSGKLLNYDLSSVGINISGAKGDNLYFAANNKVFHTNGIDGEWDLIYTLPKQPGYYNGGYGSIYKLEFYKDDDLNIYFSADNILYTIDQNHLVTPVFCAESDIEFVIFESERNIIVEENVFIITDKKFKLLDAVDMTMLSKSFFEDKPNSYNRLAYIKDVGFFYNYMELENISVWKKNFHGGLGKEKLPQTASLFGSKESIKIVTNSTNNISWIEQGNAKSEHDLFFYDAKRDTLMYRGGLDLNRSAPVFHMDETADIFTIAYYYNTNTAFSTNRGDKWHTISKYAFSDLTATEAGLIFGVSKENGLMAYDTNNDNWYKVQLPPIGTSKITQQTEDFFERDGRILALWDNKYIIESKDDGRTWSTIALPHENSFGTAFYYGEDEDMYLCSEFGLYRKEKNQTWTILSSDMANYVIDYRKIIYADKERVVFAYSKDGEIYDLYEYSSSSGLITDKDMSFKFMSNTNSSTYLFVPNDEPSILKELDRGFDEINSLNLDQGNQILNCIMDSQKSIYLGTNNGIFRCKDWFSKSEKIDTISQAVRNMHLNNDTLYVHFYDKSHLFYLTPNTNSFEMIISGISMSSYRFQHITKNNIIIVDGRKYGNNIYGDLRYEDAFAPYLYTKQSYKAEFYAKGEENVLNIYPNMKGYDVEIINFSTQDGFRAIANTDTVKYKIDHQPYQTVTLQIRIRKDGKICYQSDLLDIECLKGDEEFQTAIVMPNVYNRFKQEEEPTFRIRSSTNYSPRIKDISYQISNSLEGSTIELKQDPKRYYVDYSFKIPKNVKSGIYKISYVASSDLDFDVEGYSYYLVLNDDESSVEEQNSIITNTKVLPNPATTTADIQFEMKEAGDLTCEIYDMSGRLLLSIPTNGYYAAGKANLSIDVTNLANGQYMIFLKVQDKATAAKLLINR